ncbi:MAG: PAS domain-containing sensor histidine kinase [Gemmataceae bacterium]|nr:PAS domain-containing sensor histidine kinase [Gemmataceae bacterium]
MLQHLSPEQLAEIIDVTEDGIVTVDSQHRIVLFNRGAARLFGYEPAEVLGQSLNLLIPEQYHQSHPKDMEAFAQGPVDSRRMGSRRTVSGRRKDGSVFPAEVTISKLQHGEQLWLTAIIRDAAERKRYEDALLRLNLELEERIRQRTAELAERNRQLQQKTDENEMFVYSVSHDLRSPLVNLMGFSEELELAVRKIAELLGDPRLPAEVIQPALTLLHADVRESLTYIRTAVERLSRIIDGLLRLSRAGRVEYRWQTVEVGQIAQRVVDAHRTVINQRQAAVAIQALPPAWGDPDAIEQILANLVSNALEALPPSGGGQITIGCQPADSEGYHTYYVADNGCGIDPSLLPRLFQPFQQQSASNRKGEGIGLAIVRRVIERLGGTISVESTLQQGTTFRFTLPGVPPSGGSPASNLPVLS